MKNYLNLLLFFSCLSFGQTEFTAIKLKNNPVTINDTTQVDLLVREKTGINKGAVRKVTWPYITSLIGSMISNLSIQSISGYGIDNSDSHNPVVQSITDLPKDFFISCNWTAEPVRSNIMYYMTDQIRPLDIGSLIGGDGVYTTRNVNIIDSNTIAVIGELYTPGDDFGNYFILVLKDCKIVNNILIVGNYNWAELSDIRRDTTTTAPYNIHSVVCHRNFLYCVTRVTSGVLDNTQILKINPWDLTDVKYMTLPLTTGYDNAVGKMQAYKNNLYLLGVKTGSSPYGSMIRVDENLTESEILFQCGNMSSTQRVINSNPFLIHNDLVYIPYRFNDATNLTLAYNTIGFFVYDLYKKTEVFNTGNITITTDATSTPAPLWMTVFNGKLLMHTAGTNVANKQLIRFDIKTMTLEDAISLPCNITNENTITKDGYILLNPELTYLENLYKIKYNDFEDFESIGFEGWYSLGCHDYNEVYKESLKTKLSDFEDDLETIKTISLNGGLPHTPDSNGNIDLSVASEVSVELDLDSPVTIRKLWYGTKAEYEVLSNYDTDTNYFISGTTDNAAVANITSSYTVSPTDFGPNGILEIYANATSGAITINMPTASTVTGYKIKVIKIDSGINTVTIDGNGSELINGAANYIISTQFSNTGISSNGTQLYLLQ